MTLFYSSELACQKQRLNCHSSPLQLGSSFFPLFYDILVSGTQTQGYKLLVKQVSHSYIKHNSTCGYLFQASTGPMPPCIVAL